jgi:hypothetical protein
MHAPVEPRPYTLHTNRELGMMLRGEKPLAVFSDGLDYFPDVVLRYLRLFDRHVEAGRLVKRDYVSPDPGARVKGWHTILYALPDEAWRIDAMIELRLSGMWSAGSWTAAHERREGELLGYADWQVEYHMKRWETR